MPDAFDALSAMVPLVKTIGTEKVDVTADHAVLRLPDRADLHNHVGGPHAGVIFSLAESATGTLVIQRFSDQLDRYVPLAAGASIRYRALATGDITAEATMARTREEILAELEANGKVRFDVDALVRTADGTVTTEVTVSWALRRTSA
jgi:acyl-coenzyme A thioesterase PaaI-like protein